MTTDDPLDQALEQLERPGAYQKTFETMTPKTYEEMIHPFVTSMRALIGEVQSLRDEVAELRGD